VHVGFGQQVAALALVGLLGLAGCSAVVTTPPEPTPSDFDDLLQQRLDVVWKKTKLDDAHRPPIAAGPILSQFAAGHAFSRCMQSLGWPEYFSHDTGYGYRALQLATSDEERLNWYECFAAYPVDGEFGFASVAQYDYIYDYYRDSLIPCLRSHGYLVSRAPDRLEFRTTWFDWSDPLSPYVWNPYYEIPGYGGSEPLAVTQFCPPVPSGQTYYELN
jgi:hypothetical protein